MENGKLVEDINPSLLVNYNKLRVGFYDKVLEKGVKGKVPTLYIYIENTQENGKSILRRKVQDRRVRNNYGDLSLIPETTAYARAYDKYLQFKENIKPSAESLRIKELESKLKSQAEEVKEESPIAIELSKPSKEEKKIAKSSINSDRTIKELKAELDDLDVKYNVNATKETLLELIYNS